MSVPPAISRPTNVAMTPRSRTAANLTISRFSFGWVGAAVMALFNVAACIGWSTVNVIVGGQLVDALSGGAIPRQVGILVITLVTTLVSFYGY